ncbi:hypothetical protein ACVIWV_010264 [Bradyrhizobium diazoefficiens]|nr:hypothetical protein [Bradyrhizobium japonicum]UQE03799.1 hypothetical protein JEY30_49185 [Bradyrhizobium japonicum]WLB24667.1 hypothetical protein QIH95_51310 [Bradyrhizobium japonicum]
MDGSHFQPWQLNPFAPEFAEQYAELRAQQQVGQQPDDTGQQASFERQLDELQLSSSDEASTEAASPDPSSEAGNGGTGRTDFGASLPLSQQDNLFGSARHGIEIPRALLDASTEVRSPSHLRNSEISSVRYTSEAAPQVAAPAARSRRRGWMSRIGSRLGQAFGLDRGGKSFGASGQQPELAANTVFRVDYARRGDAEPFAEDMALISDLKAAAGRRGVPRGTLTGAGAAMRALSIWLRQTNRAPIAGRLDLNSPAHDSFLADVWAYLRAGGSSSVVRSANTLQPGSLPPLAELSPDLYREDGNLLGRFRAAAERGGAQKGAININFYNLRGFAKWLLENNKPSMAPRFRDDLLADDVVEYKSQVGDPENRLDAALSHLRRLVSGRDEFGPIGPGPQVMGRRTLAPYEADSEVIDEAERQGLRDLGVASSRKQKFVIYDRAYRLRALSHWLRMEEKEGIVGRFNGTPQQQAGLQTDIEEFRLTGAYLYNRDLTYLRNYLLLREANATLGLQPHQQPPSPAAERARLPGSPQRPADSISTWSLPSLPSDFDFPELNFAAPPPGSPQRPADSISTWSLPSLPSDFDFPELNFAAPPPSARAPSDIYGSLESLIDLNAPTPDVWPDEAQSAPAPSAGAASDIYGSLDSLIDLNTPTSGEFGDDARSMPAPNFQPSPVAAAVGYYQELDLPDLGPVVGENWRHGPQVADPVMIEILENLQLLPTRYVPMTRFFIHRERYTAELLPDGRVLLFHRP